MIVYPSIQDREDILRKQAELAEKLAEIDRRMATTPAIEVLKGPVPSASRFGKAPDSVPTWKFHR